MAEDESKASKTKRSKVVTIISILYLLIGFITALVNTLDVVVHLVGRNINGQGESFPNLLLLIAGAVWGVLMVIAGFGLWKLKRWAYWMAIVISGLLAVTNLFAFLSALSRGQSSTAYIAIIFHGLILVGLFRERVALNQKPN